MTSATTHELVNLLPILPCQLSTQVSHSLATHRKEGTHCDIIHQVAKLMGIGVRKFSRTARMTDCHHRFPQYPIRISEPGVHLVPSQIHLNPCHRMLRTSYIPQFRHDHILILCLRIEKGCNIPIVKWYIHSAHPHSTSSHITGVPAPMHLPTYSSNALVGVPSGSSR